MSNDLLVRMLAANTLSTHLRCFIGHREYREDGQLVHTSFQPTCVRPATRWSKQGLHCGVPYSENVFCDEHAPRDAEDLNCADRIRELERIAWGKQ